MNKPHESLSCDNMVQQRSRAEHLCKPLPIIEVGFTQTTDVSQRPDGGTASSSFCRKQDSQSCSKIREIHPSSELCMPFGDKVTSKRPSSTGSRRVQFNPEVRGRTFEEDMSDRHSKIYSAEDMRALQEQTRADVKHLRRLRKKEQRAKAANDDDGGNDHASPLTLDEQMALDGIALRGIEQFVSQRTWSDRTKQQRAVIHAVLGEQECLRKMGMGTGGSAMQRIANVSAILSQEARRRASALGRQDAEDARW